MGRGGRVRKLMTRTQDGDAYLVICDKLPNPKWDITGSKEVLNELLDVFEKLATYEETIEELQSKAQELDRRERGVKPSKTFVSCDDLYGYCGQCDRGVTDKFKYCPECGTKLIWESEGE